ncbi:hypothetical protein WJ968_08585 [Achromobacter xylosoxidans]
MYRRIAALALACALAPGAALADIRIGVIASSTGPGASMGSLYRSTVPLLPKTLGDAPWSTSRWTTRPIRRPPCAPRASW